MRFKIRESHICEPGLVRKENQDAFLQYISTSICVFCVADGMGGHTNGKRASISIVNGIREWIDEFYVEKYEAGFLAILDDFEKKLAEINHQIFMFYNNGQTCGSTVVALILYGDCYAVFSLGDSRVYRKRGWTFSQLTKDDTWQNSDQVPPGLSAEDRKHHGNYGKLMCALGIQESFVPHRMTDKLKSGDMFLLCSDGVYKCCDMGMLARICRRQIRESDAAMEERLQSLRAGVIAKGAPDNLTAVLVSVK